MIVLTFRVGCGDSIGYMKERGDTARLETAELFDCRYLVRTLYQPVRFFDFLSS